MKLERRLQDLLRLKRRAPQGARGLKCRNGTSKAGKPYVVPRKGRVD